MLHHATCENSFIKSFIFFIIIGLFQELVQTKPCSDLWIRENALYNG